MSKRHIIVQHGLTESLFSRQLKNIAVVDMNGSFKQMNMNEIVSLLWGAKEIIRGPIKQYRWGEFILPFVVLRRLERVLEPTKDKVLDKYDEIKDTNENLVDAVLNDVTGQHFHNRSKYNLEMLLDDHKNIHQNTKHYLDGFSKNIKDVFDKFKFLEKIDELNDEKRLYQMIQHFAKAPLDPNTVDNHLMGTIYEELIRKSSETANETAGQHFTPREVIKLMVKLLFSPHKEILKQKNLVRSVYDPAAGTGGMLSIASEYVHELNPDLQIDIFGQEMQAETYAICKSDTVLKGLEPDKIKRGNSLISSDEDKGILGDGFPDQNFHYMLSNPPFGENWGKKYYSEIKIEADKKFKGKYGPGLPRKSDGSLLFLLHMISKMQLKEYGGSRIAIVFDASPLFTGEAGSGESNIRKWIIENDMLEAVIALPAQLFYNTGLFTYIWIVTNSKELKRQGKVQLINAISFYKKMTPSLGQKRNRIDPEQIDEIVKIYENYDENEYSKIFDNEDFGYTRIIIERPLRKSFQVTEGRLERLKQKQEFKKLSRPTKLLEPRQDDVINILNTIDSRVFKDQKQFSSFIKHLFLRENFELDLKLQNAIEDALSESDETALPLINKDSMPIADPKLRDYENVPLKGEINLYFDLEVKPFVPDARIGSNSTNKVGYEIPFTKHFYKYKPLRTLEEIDADIIQLEKEIYEGIKGLRDK